MITIQSKSDCCGCSACASICPKQCISLLEDEEGFFYPDVLAENCIQCGLCEQVCPIMHATEEHVSRTPKAYAAVNLDEGVRLASSSGGVFALLGEEVIRCGGVVFGAAFSEDHRTVKHIAAENRSDLAKLCGSKYVQSELGATYVQAKSYLDAGRTVLFTGTPCQIEGLKSFLGEPYDKLLCADLICHGVPSPKVWRKYVAFREKCAMSEASEIAFRDKSRGWREYALRITFRNQAQYKKRGADDLFVRAFLQDICLRPSCYACRFKKYNRISDLTLADFWGIESMAPQIDDNRGASLVLIHSQKGHAAFQQIIAQLKWQEIDTDKALEKNSSATRCAQANTNRTPFFSRLDRTPIDKLINRYTKKNSIIKRYIKIVLKKLFRR